MAVASPLRPGTGYTELMVQLQRQRVSQNAAASRQRQKRRADPITAINPDVAVARSIARAWEQGLWMLVERTSDATFYVPSQTNPDIAYQVTVMPGKHTGPEWQWWECTCPAGEQQYPACTHMAAVWIRLWQLNLSTKMRLPFPALQPYSVPVGDRQVVAFGPSEQLLAIAATPKTPVDPEPTEPAPVITVTLPAPAEQPAEPIAIAPKRTARRRKKEDLAAAA
jgi:hypothetical protein